MKSLLTLYAAALCAFVSSAWGEQNPYRIYIDADFSTTKASAISIEQGLTTALSEADYKLSGIKVEVVRKDHRGSAPRSKRHLDEYLQDDQALVVFSGLHSPPLLAHRDFINEQGILVLDPWAAAGPITRYAGGKNWIFRLSVDDSKAGRVIVRYATETRGFKKPYLLLEETGWGKSNERTMGAALEALGIEPAGLSWFNWDLSDLHGRELMRTIENSGADVILLVANAPEAKVLISAMEALDMQIPVCSHWGITGGNFFDSIKRRKYDLDLSFIQTRFSFIGIKEGMRGYGVLQQARKLYPEIIQDPADIEAPTGFVHAYDLGKLLVRAAQQAGLTGDVAQDRVALHRALENLGGSVDGLIKTYERPFAPFEEGNPDAHEALGEADFVMGRYGENGAVILQSMEK